MTTIIVDERKRVRIPAAQPGQVFAVESNTDGSFLLIPVKAEHQEAFPPGSLLKYFNKERDELESILVKGCVQEPEPEK